MVRNIAWILYLASYGTLCISCPLNSYILIDNQHVNKHFNESGQKPRNGVTFLPFSTNPRGASVARAIQHNTFILQSCDLLCQSLVQTQNLLLTSHVTNSLSHWGSLSLNQNSNFYKKRYNIFWLSSGIALFSLPDTRF